MEKTNPNKSSIKTNRNRKTIDHAKTRTKTTKANSKGESKNTKMYPTYE